ncbi:hypothetical protein DITRI_Ditri02bG0032100 [Diplodiscus trichospermus]
MYMWISCEAKFYQNHPEPIVALDLLLCFSAPSPLHPPPLSRLGTGSASTGGVKVRQQPFEPSATKAHDIRTNRAPVYYTFRLSPTFILCFLLITGFMTRSMLLLLRCTNRNT